MVVGPDAMQIQIFSWRSDMHYNRLFFFLSEPAGGLKGEGVPKPTLILPVRLQTKGVGPRRAASFE